MSKGYVNYTKWHFIAHWLSLIEVSEIFIMLEHWFMFMLLFVMLIVNCAPEPCQMCLKAYRATARFPTSAKLKSNEPFKAASVSVFPESHEKSIPWVV